MSSREVALQQALEFVTSMQWGTVPYMETQVYFDAVQLRDAIRTALAEPQPEPVAPLQRQPLSEEDIARAVFPVMTQPGGPTLTDIARAIEKAHGIGGGK